MHYVLWVGSTMTRDKCLIIVVHQIQVLCFFMSQRVAVDYVLGQRLYGKCVYGS